jgi:hypothetical protein
MSEGRSSEEERIINEYNERFQPHEYRQVFYPPASEEGRVDALFPEGFFGSSKLLLKGVTTGALRQGIETYGENQEWQEERNSW